MGPRFPRLLLLVPLIGIPAKAQLPGNASLQGNYHVRYLGVIGSPCECPISFAGTAIFDGRGAYQINGQGTYNDGSDHTINGPGSGRYQVLSSGALRMDNPFANGAPSLTGGVGLGAVVASSTDSGYLDLFVAIPVSTGSSLATLRGTYQVAHMEFAGGSIAATRNTFFPITADGAGGLGSVTVRGTSQVLNHVSTAQPVSGAAYTLGANGAGTLSLPAPAGIPAPNQMLAGARTLYLSPDGSFFLAAATNGYDLILGVQLTPQAGNIAGLYFTGALENLADGSAAAGIYSSQGAANELGNPAGDELVHQRVNPDGQAAYDQTFADRFPIAPGATLEFAQSRYAAGPNGAIVIGSGNGARYQVSLSVKLPPLSGSGVFLNPAGVVNAATNAPFTARVSPGEVISLYGSGLAAQSTTASSLPFPTTLGGVQVRINNTPAPLYFVSPGLISAVVPYSAPSDGSLLTIQATNNGVSSNQVQVYSGQTSPGVFTLPSGGIGNGAILHSDYSLVSASNPARPGEIVQIYLTGLGAVQPAVTAGAAGPTNPLSVTVNNVAVYIDGQFARVIPFQGLAPTLGGLYQLNVAIPDGVRPGSVDLEIVTIDADNVQATIPIAR